jgi:hypothetical protein
MPTAAEPITGQDRRPWETPEFQLIDAGDAALTSGCFSDGGINSADEPSAGCPG